MITDGKAPDHAHGGHIWVPSHMRRAEKKIAVVFYVHYQSKRILVGAPEEFPIPKLLVNQGYQKAVARTSREVEIMSAMLRQQDARDEAMTDEERELIEGPARAAARQELQRLMANARNDFNREFCRAALAKLDADEELRRKTVKTSFMHAEAFEDGK